MSDAHAQFGGIDIYLFDQLQRGRITPGMTIFDAGCGSGRNIVYFLRAGYTVLGVDADPRAIASVRTLATHLQATSAPDAFRCEPLEAMSFEDGIADVVISSAVLHFARDERHFRALLDNTWRVLRPGGMLFCRLAGMAGLESQAQALGNGRYLLPDGSERFLSDDTMLRSVTAELGGVLLDPLKTTVVHGQRSMMTWVARRSES